MTTLRWPDGRGRFVDRNSDRTPVDGNLDIGPGQTVDVEDPETVDHYLDRGFVRVDGSTPDSDASESADGDGFDVDDFIDRTPVDTVIEDIEDGAADGHLKEVMSAADRVTVERAAASRQTDIEDDGEG